MTQQITVEHLNVGKDELLMVFFHRKAGKWWATVGPKNSDRIRECGEGATPAAALGELAVLIGAKPVGAN